MIEEIEELIKQYQDWLKDRTAFRILEDAVEITTPFLNRHNDYIQIYANKVHDDYILTDGGETIEDLEMCGISINTAKRRELVKMAVNGFGVTENDNIISVKTPLHKFPLAKHSLIQAIIAVNDLFYSARTLSNNIFYDDVRLWLDEIEVRYILDAAFIGKSGYTHKFHFVIPKSRYASERFVQTINHPSKNAAESIAFSWIDTRDRRQEDSTAFAVINDHERSIPYGMEDALSNYGIVPVKWSARRQAIERLAA